MARSNEIILTNKRSRLEDKLVPYLTNYKNNIQIHKYIVDFINVDTRHIIEVYGDYWHCNPTIYKETFIHPYYNMTAKEIREKDSDRIKYLESLGYTITII